jgi:lipopolysaccharide export system protein LptA
VIAAALAALALAAAPPEPAAASPQVTVDADEIQYLYREGKVVFTGKPLVRLTREDAVLTCRKLVAENDESGKIRKATCTGDVRLVRGPRVVTCDTATYVEAQARVTCAGNPVLRDGDNVLRGEELVYDLAADQATLTGAKGTIVPKPGQDLAPRRKASPQAAPAPAKEAAK